MLTLFFLFLSVASLAGWAYISFFHESRGRDGGWFWLRRFLSVSSVAMFICAGGGVKSLADLGAAYLIAALLVGGVLAAWRWLRGEGGGGDRDHLRGQALASAEAVAREIARPKTPVRLEIGGVPIPIEVEDRGFLLAGSPGTGKSQAITRALDTLQADGHRAVVADASGIFYSRYAGAGAVLFNPYDARSVNWSPLADVTSPEDCTALARSIIPDGTGEAAEWSGYAQTLLEAVLEHVWQNGGNTGEVLRLAAAASADELRETLPPGPVHALLDPSAAKMLGSVRAIVGTRLKPFAALDPAAGRGAFSIRSFIENESGWLFVSYKQSQRDAMRPLIAAAIDIAARAVLDLPPAQGDRASQRRTWFVLDELPLLGRISSLVTLLTNGSKHGAAVIAGLQTVAQLRETYGHDAAQTILATLGTWLTLRVSDTETADYMSRALGDEEIRRVVQSGSESTKSGEIGKSTSESWQEQYHVQRVVLPSELQNLPDLCGYLNIAGPLPACPVRLPLAERREPVAEPFVQAERKPLAAPAAARIEEKAAEAETPVFTLGSEN